MNDRRNHVSTSVDEEDTHVHKLRLRLMYYVTEYGVHPSCIINMDETAAKLLGLGQRGWARPKQDGRVRFIGAADERNPTISTVVTMTRTIMAQLIVEGATKRVVQDLPQHENIPSARATGAPRAHARS